MCKKYYIMDGLFYHYIRGTAVKKNYSTLYFKMDLMKDFRNINMLHLRIFIKFSSFYLSSSVKVLYLDTSHGWLSIVKTTATSMVVITLSTLLEYYPHMTLVPYNIHKLHTTASIPNFRALILFVVTCKGHQSIKLWRTPAITWWWTLSFFLEL